MPKLTPEEALRCYWNAWCDADWHLINDDACEDGAELPEVWEGAGLIQERGVDADDLDDPFAAERGIVPGGTVWCLTPAGRAALAKAGEG